MGFGSFLELCVSTGSQGKESTKPSRSYSKDWGLV